MKIDPVLREKFKVQRSLSRSVKGNVRAYFQVINSIAEKSINAGKNKPDLQHAKIIIKIANGSKSSPRNSVK